MIDSEPVPWGKGEKQPGEGGEIVPETVCLQWVGARIYMGDSVPIEEWACELLLCGKLKDFWSVGVAKASLNGQFSRIE